MTFTPSADTITLDGRPLGPGEPFTPFPDEPDYTVTFLGISHGMLCLFDSHGTFGCPVHALPIADTERPAS